MPGDSRVQGDEFNYDAVPFGAEKIHRMISTETASSEGSSSEDLSSGSSSQGSDDGVYPSSPESIDGLDGIDPRLQLKSALHRLFTFPVGLPQKLRLNVQGLASVGFFWNKEGRLECFRCKKMEDSIIQWQGLNRREIQIRHYDCTHPADDDIPLSKNDCLFNYEAHRLYSFYDDNWTSSCVDPKSLAKSGFYYTGREDICKCFSCNLEVRDWSDEDTADSEHRKWNSGCPFLNGRPVGNFTLGKELEPKPEHQTDSLEIRPFARAENDTSRRILPDVVRKGIEASQRPPVHASMATYEARLESFKNWPTEKTQTPKDLAEAGFFYLGKEDAVLCFQCDGGLKEWADGDEPWVLHAKWFNCCQYLREKMGKNFIVSVQRVHKAIMPMKDFKEAIIETERVLRERRKAQETQQKMCPVG